MFPLYVVETRNQQRHIYDINTDANQADRFDFKIKYVGKVE